MSSGSYGPRMKVNGSLGDSGNSAIATLLKPIALSTNRAFGAPALDIVLIVAEVGQDFVGMLAELGRERADRSGRLRELDRNSDLLDLLAVGRLDLDDHVARADLGVVLEFVERQHPAHADVVFGQHLPPLVARFRFEDLGEARLD